MLDESNLFDKERVQRSQTGLHPTESAEDDYQRTLLAIIRYFGQQVNGLRNQHGAPKIAKQDMIDGIAALKHRVRDDDWAGD